MVGGGRPLLSEILGQPARVGAPTNSFFTTYGALLSFICDCDCEIADFEPKKVQLTLIGGPLRAFQRA